MTSTPAESANSEPDERLRPLLARIWRDYLKARWPLLAGATEIGRAHV